MRREATMRTTTWRWLIVLLTLFVPTAVDAAARNPVPGEPYAAGSCDSEDPCPFGFACVQRRCAVPCNSDDDCVKGGWPGFYLQCQRGVCTWAERPYTGPIGPAPIIRCHTDRDCLSHQLCVGGGPNLGVCHDICFRDKCKEDEICSDVGRPQRVCLPY